MKKSIIILIAIVIFTGCRRPVKLSMNLTQSLLMYQPITLNIDGIDSISLFNPANTKVDLIVTTPSGKIISVPAFAAKEVSRYETTTDMEVPQFISKPFWLTEKLNNESDFVIRYKSDGKWMWKVMINPSETGEYKVVVNSIINGKRQKSNELIFQVKKSDIKGFIQIAKTNPRAFEYQNGENYLPIGNNLSYALTPLSKDRLATYKEWINKLAESHANIIRLWMGAEWCFGLERSSPYNYNQEAAFLLDSVFKMCQGKNINIILCLDYVRNIKKTNNKFSFYRDDYPYIIKNGGTCNNENDFLLQDSAKNQWKAMMRYTIARWGAYTSLFSIELWNEMDCFASERRYVVEWTAEMCSWLKVNDPYHHLKTNSLGSRVIWPELWELKDIDYVNYHDYGGDRYRTIPMYDVFSDTLRSLYKIEKPVLLSECGLVEKWLQFPATTHRKYDPSGPKDFIGYAFHEALWIGLMGGGAGSGMHWWWDVMVNDMNYYSQYQAFFELTKDIPMNKFEFKVLRPDTNQEITKCFARSSDWGTFLWLVNIKNNWRDLVINKKTPVVTQNASIKLTLNQGFYWISYYNPFNGKQILVDSLKSDGTEFTIKLPDFSNDLFVKIIKK